MGMEGREVNSSNIVTKFLGSKVKDLFFILRVLCSKRQVLLISRAEMSNQEITETSIIHLKD